MKRNTFLAVMIFSVALLPSIATAAVIMNNPVSVNTSNNQPSPVYLSEGPSYSVAHQLGYIGLTGNGKSSTGSQALYVNGTSGTGNVTLLNVLSVANNTASGFTGSVYLYFNGTLPAGVTVYYGASEMSYNGNYITGGTRLATGTAIHLSGSELYLSIVVSGSVQNAQNDVIKMQVAYS